MLQFRDGQFYSRATNKYAAIQGWAIVSHKGPDLEKTVEAAGCTLIGKLGDDLFFVEITVHVQM